MSQVAQVKFIDYQRSISKALDLINAQVHLPQEGLIIIKPNLTNSSPPPVTTPAAATEAVYCYCRRHSKAIVAIGEGCGSGKTDEVYKKLGYAELAKRHSIDLIDFNTAETEILKNKEALQLKEFHMPIMVPDAYVISLPVLKDHSFTQTTISMKNMFGIAPGRYYAGSWNKSKLHSPSTHKSVVDICRYKKPDLSVVDASVALKGMHLSGTPENIGLILAGFDPVAIDAVGSELLGHNARKLEYISLANGIIGSMDMVEILE